MSRSDTLSDFLTRLRNAATAGQGEFEADGNWLKFDKRKVGIE